MSGLTVSTFNFQPGKVRFDCDIFDPYTFARVKYRIDTTNSLWQNVGGFGIFYPTSSVNAFGLIPGTIYRAHGRLFCDSNITAYRSPSWTNPPIYWSQPNSPIRNGIDASSDDISIFPNPSNGIFNLSHNLEFKSDLVIQIHNSIGELVYEKLFEEYIGEINLRFNLTEFSSSIYFISVNDNISIYNKKLIVE